MVAAFLKFLENFCFSIIFSKQLSIRSLISQASGMSAHFARWLTVWLTKGIRSMCICRWSSVSTICLIITMCFIIFFTWISYKTDILDWRFAFKNTVSKTIKRAQWPGTTCLFWVLVWSAPCSLGSLNAHGNSPKFFIYGICFLQLRHNSILCITTGGK